LPWLAALSGRGAWLALPCLALPLGLRQIARFRRAAGPTFNQLLAGTAGLQLVFALLLAVGLLARVP
ncbi:MAG TPA: 1,4-dihydroxy-2-naphthoate octaprenyltransferase, partial [Candidatus Accumulibacter sp.]|nr:1,4-dihydroxy-2-naphthoate octaprenyltransferase [Accumulibacter sp.]